MTLRHSPRGLLRREVRRGCIAGSLPSGRAIAISTSFAPSEVSVRRAALGVFFSTVGTTSSFCVVVMCALLSLSPY